MLWIAVFIAAGWLLFPYIIAKMGKGKAQTSQAGGF